VVQARAPAVVRGRVIGLFPMLFTAAFAVGSLVQGAVADRVGLRVVTVVAAVAFCAALAGFAAWRRADVEALGEPAGDATTAAPRRAGPP
jgi:MFS family permease